MSPTITVPIRARYEIVEGQAILREAEYAEVDVKIIAEMLLKASHKRIITSSGICIP